MTVGNGVEKTGAANEITFDLEVLLNAIITWNGGPGWDTKTINTIKDLGTIKAALE